MPGIHATDFGKALRGMHHVGRLVGPAAMRHGRQERGIGFDQDPVGRQVPRDVPQILSVLERDDAGKGHIHAEVDGAFCQRPRAGETMDHARSLARMFLLEGAAMLREEAHGVGIGRAVQINETAAAFAGVAMGFNGLLTALWAPLLVPWIVGS